MAAYIAPGKPVSGTTSSIAAVDTDGERKIREHCIKRKTLAKQDRSRHKGRIEDCYRFALPWRHKFDATQQSLDQIDDLYDSTAMGIVEDFAADMLSTFTPMRADWVDIEPVGKFDAGDLSQLKQPLQKYKEVLFDEIRRSNLDAALQESYLDLGPGTMALVIQDRHPTEPIHCQAIALTDLIIDRGPWGEIDGKWREMRIKAADVPVIWKDAKPLTVDEMGENREALKDIDLTDGVYRDWDSRDTEKWRYVVFTERRLLLNVEYTGAGSSPFIVARWSRDVKTAWGIGPTYRELPNFKTLNHVAYLVLKNLDKNVDPAFSYENDGVINVDGGVNPGDWIPREIGSEAPEPLEPKNKFEIAFITKEDLVSSIKRAHYQDEPDQPGKTPPTAEQWRDMAIRKARRMGTPATNLVHDLQYPIINRFAYLLAKRGVLPKVELNGEVVALRPVSPLLRAQEMEEVERVKMWAAESQQLLGPEMFNAWFKGEEYLSWSGKKVGAPDSLIRTKTEMQEMVGTIAQLGQQTGMLPGGEGGGGAPPAA